MFTERSPIAPGGRSTQTGPRYTIRGQTYLPLDLQQLSTNGFITVTGGRGDVYRKEGEKGPVKEPRRALFSGGYVLFLK